LEIICSSDNDSVFYNSQNEVTARTERDKGG